jgi:hypothetical protein
MKNKLLLTSLTLFCSLISFSQVRVQAVKVDDSFDEESSAILDTSMRELEQVFNSEKFKQMVLNETFDVGNFNLSSEDIYELIISGKDNYIDKPEDNSIDIRVRVFDKYAGSGNFGFTDMKTRITRTHRCYILKNSRKCYTSHLAHEYMHQIGFYDKRTWLFGKKTSSVPYKIGRIVDELIENDAKCFAKKETCSK